MTEATVAKYAMLEKIDFDHPIFAPFAESQFSDFTGIRFWKHRTIAGLKDGAANKTADGTAPAAITDRVLARFDDGDPAIIEFSVKRGKVIVCASGWQPADSQFARSSKFPMLIFRLLEHSNGIAPRLGSQDVGSVLAWPLISRFEHSATGTARLPNGTELTALSLDEPFSTTEQPGIYTLSVPGKTEQIAVNLAADESRTTPLTMEQLESYGLKLRGRDRTDEPRNSPLRQRQLQLAEMEQSQKLWQRILVAVMVILLLETWSTGWFGVKTPTVIG